MTNEQKTVDNMTVEQWLAIRKAAALHVDPETAEVMWQYADLTDPYGLHPDRRAECIGKVWFARPSGSDVWVCVDDLRNAIWSALKKKMEARRAFPEPTAYRRARELLIVSEDQEQCMLIRIEQVPKLIEKMLAALKEHDADAP
jgi:hypothetical protein